MFLCNTKQLLKIIKDITDCSLEDAKHYLEMSNNNPKTAVLMMLKKMNAEDAGNLLQEYDGSLRQALEA